MEHSVLLGVSLVMVAGFMSGCCMLPVKFVRSWKWENVWLVFSILSLVVIPESLALAFVGRLFDTYRALILTPSGLETDLHSKRDRVHTGSSSGARRCQAPQRCSPT